MAAKKRSENVIVTFRLHRDVVKELKGLARRRRTTVTEQVRIALSNHLEQKKE